MDADISIDELTFAINGCPMAVLNTLGHGFHEKLYENALAVELAERGIPFKTQQNYDVVYKNKNIGCFVSDFVVGGRVVVEIKTVDRLGHHEKGQVLNYLRVCNLSLGLLLNFKNPKLEWQRIILS